MGAVVRRAPTQPESAVRTILLLRHGETAWNRERRVMGHENVPLSDAGRAQCERVGALLERWSVDRIVSSPLERARQSAEIIARCLDIEVETDERLAEVRFGRWQGKRYSEIIDDPEYHEFLKDPVGSPTPGGETIADVQRRGLAAIEERATPAARTLFVSHGDIVRSAICHFLAIPLAEFRRIRVDNCGLTAITEAAGRPEVKFVNLLVDSDRAWDPLHWSSAT